MTSVSLSRHLDTLLNATIRNSGDRLRVIQKINDVINYRPTIAILGKTGVGKSSLCNALFGQDIAEVSDVEACTRQPQEVLLGLGNKSLCLVDLPGVGESRSRDDEYAALYYGVLPKTDVILWLLKADDRAYSVDEEFYKTIVAPHVADNKPFFFVLAQADKIEPFREWNEKESIPGPNQQANLEKRRQYVAKCFDIPLSKVLTLSASENYRLTNLVEEIVFALPDEKKVGLVREVKPEMVSQRTRTETKAAFARTLGSALTGAGIGAAIGSVIPGIGTALGAGIGSVLGWLFG